MKPVGRLTFALFAVLLSAHSATAQNQNKSPASDRTGAQNKAAPSQANPAPSQNPLLPSPVFVKNPLVVDLVDRPLRDSGGVVTGIIFDLVAFPNGAVAVLFRQTDASPLILLPVSALSKSPEGPKMGISVQKFNELPKFFNALPTGVISAKYGAYHPV